MRSTNYHFVYDFMAIVFSITVAIDTGSCISYCTFVIKSDVIKIIVITKIIVIPGTSSNNSFDYRVARVETLHPNFISPVFKSERAAVADCEELIIMMGLAWGLHEVILEGLLLLHPLLLAHHEPTELPHIHLHLGAGSDEHLIIQRLWGLASGMSGGRPSLLFAIGMSGGRPSLLVLMSVTGLVLLWQVEAHLLDFNIAKFIPPLHVVQGGTGPGHVDFLCSVIDPTDVLEELLEHP